MADELMAGACTHLVELVTTSLDSLVSLPDARAAVALNGRMLAWEQVDRLHERSYAERGIIAGIFDKRQLWKHLEDPQYGVPFTSWTAWASSGFLGCRRVTIEAKKDMEALADIPSDKLLSVPKSNIKILKQLSTAVRNDDAVLQAASTLEQNEFLERIERDHPHQHIESTSVMRFHPGKTGARTVEQAIAWAIEHDIAGTRDEALVRMAEVAMHEWELDQELREMDEHSAEPATA